MIEINRPTPPPTFIFIVYAFVSLAVEEQNSSCLLFSFSLSPPVSLLPLTFYLIWRESPLPADAILIMHIDDNDNIDTAG